MIDIALQYSINSYISTEKRQKMIKANNNIKNGRGENNSCCCIKRILCIEEQLRHIDDKIQAIVKCLADKPMKSYIMNKNRASKPNEKLPQNRFNVIIPESDREQENKKSLEKIQGVESESDSFLLEDLQFIERSKVQRLKEMGNMINIGEELDSLSKKIDSLTQQTLILPKIKSNISMQAKILEYLQEKTEKMKEQLPKSTQKINMVQPEKSGYRRREQSISLDSLCFSDESQIQEVHENIYYKNI